MSKTCVSKADPRRHAPAAASLRFESLFTFLHRTLLIPNQSRIARTAGNIVLSSGGVVRGISNWGTFLLPARTRRPGGAFYHHGHYFILRFDSSAKTQHALRKTLALDPRLLNDPTFGGKNGQQAGGD